MPHSMPHSPIPPSPYIHTYSLHKYTYIHIQIVIKIDNRIILINMKHRPSRFIIGNDLDSIRALFSEKEKELSIAVAKVESLTKQLEEIKRDRRGPLHLLQTSAINNGGKSQHNASTAARELDKLRKELMVSKE